MTQIIMGLKHLHTHNMTHGSLNCKNIIVDEYGNIKLSNYGELNHLFETYAIKNQEVNISLKMQNENSSDLLELKRMKQNDILGIGCTIYEFVTGEIINSSNTNF